MKRVLLISALVCSFLFFGNGAYAVPTLQLDIIGGTYVGEPDATTYSVSDSFTLRALLYGDYTSSPFYISAAVAPQVTEGADLGSFVFNGETVAVTGDMQFGVPPVELATKDLSDHGIFDTYFKEFSFTFDKNNIINPAYNVQDDTTANGFLYYADFAVDISGLEAGYSIHFDLYGDLDGDGKLDFAPFSHDAQSITATSTGNPVPEPATLFLLGSGLVGAGIFRRKRSN